MVFNVPLRVFQSLLAMRPLGDTKGFSANTGREAAGPLQRVRVGVSRMERFTTCAMSPMPARSLGASGACNPSARTISAADGDSRRSSQASQANRRMSALGFLHARVF